MSDRRLPSFSTPLWSLLVFATVASSICARPSVGQETREASVEPDLLIIPRIQSTIELDGRPDEAVWEEARKLPLVQQRPNFGAEPTEKTEVLIGYTEEALYVACRCYDQRELSAPSFRRDYPYLDSDQFGFLLDTFNDNENGLLFATTPTGLRTDAAVSNDAAGSVPLDLNWDSFWDAEATQNDKGWFAEMRVPISSLRFDTGEGGQAVMGLIAIRFLSRENEFDLFPETPSNWGTYSHIKPSQARKVVFEDLQPEPPLRVRPYLLGGLGQQSVLNDSETAYRRQTDPTYDAGLDVKYGLTSNLTLDLTVNTDFAQVEADNQQINLTRFPLFFPEKRQFFQERSSNFAFDFSGSNRLFYSRRIGLYQGHQTRILGGTRLVGRSGPWDIGVLNMQTAREPQLGPEGEALPSENFGVARFRRQVVNQSSYVGGIFTSRVGMEASYNVAYGADGIFRVGEDQYVTARWAQTVENGSSGGGSSNDLVSLAPTRLHLRWEDRSYEGIGYDLRYDRAGKRYTPGVGLELRENYFRVGDQIGYGWIPNEGSALQRHRISAIGEAYFRNADRSLQSLEVGPEWEVNTNSDHSLTLTATHRIEDLRRGFSISNEARVPAGRYGFQEASVSYLMPTEWDLRTSAKVTGGGFYDGRRATVQVSPTWNASRYLRLTGFYQLNRISFLGRGQNASFNTFTAHVSRLRVEVTPSVEYSISSFLQYNSARGAAIGNLRFRYNPREGNDLYLVYNERLNTDRSPIRSGAGRSATGPRLPLSSQRAMMLKYTYTFNW